MTKKTTIPQGWITLNNAIDFIKTNLMTNNTRFVLDNFTENKYLTLRIDMRTGNTIIQPGNKIQNLNKELEITKKLLNGCKFSLDTQHKINTKLKTQKSKNA